MLRLLGPDARASSRAGDLYMELAISPSDLVLPERGGLGVAFSRAWPVDLALRFCGREGDLALRFSGLVMDLALRFRTVISLPPSVSP